VSRIWGVLWLAASAIGVAADVARGAVLVGVLT